MKKRMIAFLCTALVAVFTCAYGEYSPGCLMQPPREVLDHIARDYPGYTLEDYCEVYDTPDGDYGFAMLKAGDERMLLGYEEKGGKMTYWLKNHGAVMQGEEEAWFDSRAKGTTVYGENHEIQQADGLSFSITQLDSAGETYNKYIAYHWENGGFKLTGYKDWDGFYGEVAVDDGELHFKNWLEGWDFGKVYGTVQRDLRYVSFTNLPKSIEEARESVTKAPDIPQGGLLQPAKVKFTGGQKYPVYTGPGEQYERSGNGKGSVSTNDWIQVFGRVDDYIMIQYDISAERYRIGWIDAAALPKDAKVPWISFGGGEQMLQRDCTLTDDPLNSGTALYHLSAGTQVINLCNLGYDWVYIQVNENGKPCCGFVPAIAFE
ncbi:MAG: hypothetical protein IJ418_17545 [Clostridia bacterium]|nr:hypothetical protein [Clostridia bacterium]